MDYKKTAIEGAVVGGLLSLFFFRGRPGLGKVAKFSALGAGAAVAGTYVLLDKKGIGLLSGGHVAGAPLHHHHLHNAYR